MNERLYNLNQLGIQPAADIICALLIIWKADWITTTLSHIGATPSSPTVNPKQNGKNYESTNTALEI